MKSGVSGARNCVRGAKEWAHCGVGPEATMCYLKYELIDSEAQWLIEILLVECTGPFRAAETSVSNFRRSVTISEDGYVVISDLGLWGTLKCRLSYER